MAKSMVEKYEQILSADPGSMVFVELAKALLDRGDSKRAIDICSAGIQHHPESVVGRVLWGKALINSGHAAEAMAQFDEAIAIDRENPYAYNLIGEVLLHKGLHRSALPILKKAVALQPTDGRVRQWLEQTTRALNGDKTPVKRDFTQVDPPPESQATSPGRPSLPSAMGASEPTAVNVAALPEPTLPPEAAPITSPGPAESHGQNGELVRGMTDIFQSLEAREAAQGSAVPLAPAPPPATEEAPPEPGSPSPGDALPAAS
jgi:tetratricopeptide (TPR) repeat protein